MPSDSHNDYELLTILIGADWPGFLNNRGPFLERIEVQDSLVNIHAKVQSQGASFVHYPQEIVRGRRNGSVVFILGNMCWSMDQRAHRGLKLTLPYTHITHISVELPLPGKESSTG